jgi:4-hydroxybenzoate polyprenyltransferase
MARAARKPAPAASQPLPIVVDLEGTLLVADTLDEGVATIVFGRPVRLPAAVLALLHGRAAFKTAVAGSQRIDIEALPAREGLLEWLREQRAQGAALHLVTSSHQSIADAVARRFGIFDSATGSDPESGGDRFHLKGQAKCDYLRRRFPDGFVYCGDSRTDIPVFLAARAVVLCDTPASAQAAVSEADVAVLARFDRQPLQPIELFKAFRIHQWSKNVLIFAPLFLGHVYTHVDAILRAVAGFAILSLLATASYLANDIADLGADRHHKSKRLRALASGRLSLRLAFLLAPLLAIGAFAAAFALSPPFAAALLFYFVLTTLYSWRLKRVPLLDVFVIGTLFTSRIVMGAAVVGVVQSIWLLSFAMFLFFSLALAKRHVEILAAADTGGEALHRSRGYRPSDWPLTLILGLGSGLVSVVIMLLYMTADAEPSGFYRHTEALFAIPAALMLWIMRVWLLSHRGELEDDPVVFALKDKTSLALAGVVALAFAAAVV